MTPAILTVALLLGRDPALVAMVWHSFPLDPRLACAVVEYESGFNPRRVVVERDKRGRVIGTSWGLFGLCDRWHPQYRKNLALHIREGAGFLLVCCLMAGNERDGLAAYNKWFPIRARGLAYAKRVMAIYARLRR